MTQVEQMTAIETIEDRLERIDNAINLIFEVAERLFYDKDKGEVTTELKLLVDIGAQAAIMKVCCNKIRAQVEVLKDLESEVTNTTK